jgi:hypothetical protein
MTLEVIIARFEEVLQFPCFTLGWGRYQTEAILTLAKEIKALKDKVDGRIISTNEYLPRS